MCSNVTASRELSFNARASCLLPREPVMRVLRTIFNMFIIYLFSCPSSSLQPRMDAMWFRFALCMSLPHLHDLRFSAENDFVYLFIFTVWFWPSSEIVIIMIRNSEIDLQSCYSSCDRLQSRSQ